MISNVMNAAVTGLQAASNRLNVSANNVANQMSAEGGVYEAQQVQQTSLAVGGVQSTTTLKDPATVAGPEGDLPNVDTASEVIQQQIASYDFKANLKVLETADEMAEEAINILA